MGILFQPVDWRAHISSSIYHELQTKHIDQLIDESDYCVFIICGEISPYIKHELKRVWKLYLKKQIRNVAIFFKENEQNNDKFKKNC